MPNDRLSIYFLIYNFERHSFRLKVKPPVLVVNKITRSSELISYMPQDNKEIFLK